MVHTGLRVKGLGLVRVYSKPHKVGNHIKAN